MITTKLRILLIEDYKTDADLIEYHIGKIVETFEIKVTDTLEDCNYLLNNFLPDVIISDYNLPTCTGLDILNLAQSFDESIPFIFLTGTIDDDELAANTILSGASGFILKKHMNHLEDKLRPLLKQVVFNMVQKDEIREKLRQNKIAVNQIHQYLESINADNDEQIRNVALLRKSIEEIHEQRNDAEKDKIRKNAK